MKSFISRYYGRLYLGMRAAMLFSVHISLPWLHSRGIQVLIAFWEPNISSDLPTRNNFLPSE